MKNCLYFFLLTAILMVLEGCSPQKQPSVPAETLDPNCTIGSLTDTYAPEAIRVRGIGIVAGLAGTGSSECPAEIRNELEKYIWQQLPNKGSINPRTFINSLDTAVVEVVGTVPYLADNQETFDIVVKPLSSTQTTSLDGGYLYTTELKEMSRLSNIKQFTQFSKTIATAAGPIYSNKIKAGLEKNWYVMGGGKPVQDASVKLALKKPGFLAANAIRNRINERFGPKTCIPNSPSDCTVYFPARYKNQKTRFLQLVNSLILSENDAIRKEYAASAIRKLIDEPDKTTQEVILEGIGKSIVDELKPLLKHPDEKVRFHAARCMLSIGNNDSLQYLRSIVIDPKSPYRLDAIRAIGMAASKDSKPLLMSALSEENTDVRLAAYEMMVLLDSAIVSRKTIGGGNFIIDSVVCGGPGMIYAYQQDTPKIVLFGCPLVCDKNIFIQSDDAGVTLNALPGDKYISVSRKHPNRPRVIGPIKSSFELSILLQTIGEMPEVSQNTGLRPGLAVPYADILPLLQKMCANNAVKAKFVAGPELDTSTFQDLNVLGR